MNNIQLPKEAKPHETPILFAFAMGYRDAPSIQKLLNHKHRKRIYQTLEKFNDVLPSLMSVDCSPRRTRRSFMRVS